MTETEYIVSYTVKAAVFLNIADCLCNNIREVFRNSWSGRKSGRFNTRSMYKLRIYLAGSENKVIGNGMSAKSGK